MAVERLKNGNTFIATNNGLMEVTKDGKEVFNYNRNQWDIITGSRSPDGQYAVLTNNGQIIRVDSKGKELKTFPVNVHTSGGRIEVLLNGRVLVPEMRENKVVEYDAEGKVQRTFDVADGWGGNHAWGPAFVLTHEIPDGWPRPNSTVHFVSDGIESAVKQAKAAAAGKSVGVHGADTIQQLLNAGLLDEIHVDIAAVLLGSGVRLFDRLAGTPVVLGNPTVIPGVGVTHLRYPVRKA